MYFQLPQIEQDGADNGRRFRVENGDSPGEKEEVRRPNDQTINFFVSLSFTS